MQSQDAKQYFQNFLHVQTCWNCLHNPLASYHICNWTITGLAHMFTKSSHWILDLVTEHILKKGKRSVALIPFSLDTPSGLLSRRNHLEPQCQQSMYHMRHSVIWWGYLAEKRDSPVLKRAYVHIYCGFSHKHTHMIYQLLRVRVYALVAKAELTCNQ